MTISYSLAPIPKWYFVDLTGKPLGSGKMYTYSSNNKSQFKPVYQDPAGLIPWDNPIDIDANGTKGPFYWKVDTSTNDAYYIEVYDVNDNLIWNLDGFIPPAGSGGSTTVNIDLKSFVTNGIFYRNLGSSASPLPTQLTLAPSAHEGFIEPDIIFKKNNTNATDQIIFQEFSLGQTPLTGDTTPQFYLNYVCTNAGAGGETFKYIQFPISAKVKNLENQQVTFSMWAKGNAGGEQLQFYVIQNFGSGGTPTSPILSLAGTATLTTGWAQHNQTYTIPSCSGKVLGTCGDDYLAIAVQVPLSVTCNVSFTKVGLYLGAISPSAEYETYDEISAIIDSPRTGDIRPSMNYSSYVPGGWVPMKNGTIGSASSNASARANLDTFPLYKLLWDNVIATYAPIFDSSGNYTTRGGTAVEDFTSNKALSLPPTLGRVFGCANPTADGILKKSFVTDLADNFIILDDTSSFFTGTRVRVFTVGTSVLPTPLVNNGVYYVIDIGSGHLQFATSQAQAVTGVPDITLGGSPSGLNQISIDDEATFFGYAEGESEHTPLDEEMAAHNHPGSTININNPGNVPGHVSVGDNTGAATIPVINVASQGGGNPFNVTQPTVYGNYLIKL